MFAVVSTVDCGDECHSLKEVVMSEPRERTPQPSRVSDKLSQHLAPESQAIVFEERDRLSGLTKLTRLSLISNRAFDVNKGVQD